MIQRRNSYNAYETEGDGAIGVSDHDTRYWQLHLLLPPDANPEAIPTPLRAVLIGLFDALLRHSVAGQPNPISLRYCIAGDSAESDLVREWMGELAGVIARWWGYTPSVHVVSSDTMPRLVCRVNPLSVLDTGNEKQPEEWPSIAVTFSPDVDSLAAATRIVERAGGPPVLVIFDTIAEHWIASQSGLAKILDRCQSRLATIAIRSPDTLHHMGARIKGLGPCTWGPVRVLHSLTAVCVALACDLDEVHLPENGITNLGLSTIGSTQAETNPLTPDLVLLENLNRWLLRIIGRPMRISNPLLRETPAEITANLISDSKNDFAIDVDGLIELVANDNDYKTRVEHAVSVIAGISSEKVLTRELRRLLMQPLLSPVQSSLADAYLESIRILSGEERWGTGLLRSRYSHSERLELGQNALRGITSMARRHAESVRKVMSEAVSQYASEIIAGELEPDCLLVRLVRASVIERDISSKNTAIGENVFRKRSDCWEVRFAGREAVYLKSSKGISYIHLLLQAPRRIFSAIELRDAVAGYGRLPTSNLGPQADASAVESYRRRWNELRVAIDEAEKNNDIGRCETLTCELDFLEREIHACVGLGGRLRQNSDNERARKSVSNAIYRAMNHTRSISPTLTKHLQAALQIGSSVAYMPMDEMEWDT